MSTEALIEFSGADGVQLVGVWTQPASPTAVVLMTHGLPSDRDEWGFYSGMSQYLASAGVASFRFDFHCCGESGGGAFEMLTMSAMKNDMDAAARILTERSLAKRYMVATSASGGIAWDWLQGADLAVERLFLMAPVLNYQYEVFGQLPRGAELASVQTDNGYGLGMANDAVRFDPVALGTAKFPVTIFHGTADTVVPFHGSAEASERTSAELVAVDGVDHGFAALGDEDLSWPETKRNHRYIYEELLRRIAS